MSGLLEGLRVVVSGSSRELRVAASWFSDLGAKVQLRSPNDPDMADRLWLGHPDVAAAEVAADLLVLEHGADSGGLSAPVTVRYAGTGSTAPEPNAHLDGRGLAAAGAVAVAIGEPDRPPLPVPDGCLEHMIGTHVVAASIAALLEGTSEVEVAGVDVVAWSVATNANLYVPYGAQWHRAGRRANGGGGGYPYAVFDVADGQFVLIGRTPRDWEALVKAMGAPPWTEHPRYLDRRAMAQRYPDDVDGRMEPWLKGLTRDELASLAAEFGFPGGPIYRPEEVLRTPSLEGRWHTGSHGGSSAQVLDRPYTVVSTAGRREVSALSDTLVLDLSWVWSGPAVGVALADLGATVIKVESSTRPDNSRLRGKPSKLEPAPGAPPLELTPYFHAVNRGKRSISLNLKTVEGRELLVELASQADVIIENLSPGVMERFGIAPHQVHENNPDCVYVAMRGYREHPTTVGLRAYAPVLSGGAGIEALVAYESEPPVGMMTYGFSDANAASQGLLLALAGLYARHTKSTGAAITLSQLEAAIAANGRNLVSAQTGDADYHLRPFGDNEPVVTLEELPTAPWTSPDLFTSVTTPWIGDLPVSCLPWRRDGEFRQPTAAGPVLGEHTETELAGRLGIPSDRIDVLRRAGILT